MDNLQTSQAVRVGRKGDMWYKVYFGFFLLAIGISWNSREGMPSWAAFVLMMVGSMFLAYAFSA